MKSRFLLAIAALMLAGPTLASRAWADPVVGGEPQGVRESFVAEVPQGYQVAIWAQGLDTPWSLVFLPDGRALVSERAGRIRMIEPDGKLRPQPVASVAVHARGEGGLMGLALHPDFPRQPYLYAMHTLSDGAGVHNRVIRMRFDGGPGSLATFDRVILDGIVGGTYHNGGRIAFGPDRRLYVGAGEGFVADRAQAVGILGGKILRVADDGAIPPDNPFPNSPVWTYGNRNVQGLAWHPKTGELIASEHGPSGEYGLAKNDEINVIQRGGNYGWPKAVGAPHVPELIDPIVVWAETGAPPSGMTFWNGDLFVATLRSEALVRIGLESQGQGRYRVMVMERWLSSAPGQGRFGRLRDAVAGPGQGIGNLYVLTNGRAGGDVVLRISQR